MADEETLEEVERSQISNGGGQKNPLLLIVLILNLIVMGAVAYFQFETHNKISQTMTTQDIERSAAQRHMVDGEEVVDTGEARERDGILFPLEGFTANLAQGDGPRRFVRLNAVLKFSKDSNEEEFKARQPQIRDAVISTLNSKRAEDLLKVEGKNFLKEEIKAAINTFLVDGQVIDVFYVSFQVN